MTITSHQLLRLYATPYASRGLRGMVEAVKRSAGTNRQGYPTLAPALRTHLDSLPADHQPRPEYDNPTTVPPRAAQVTTPLTPSDIAWLSALPADPADVSYEDAQALARLDGDFGPAGAADARLVRSKLDPIRRFHDAKAAHVALANLEQTPAPNVNRDEAVGLLMTALRNEVPELTEPELMLRAGTQLDEVLKTAANTRQRDLERAHAEVRRASRPWNVGDAFESPAYLELAKNAAMFDSSAGRVVREHAALETAGAT
jgi:hypothetical protein